jgi:hypothetical protein
MKSGRPFMNSLIAKFPFSLLFFLCFTGGLMAQNTPCDKVVIKTEQDAPKANSCALQAANYLLSQSLKSADKLIPVYRLLVSDWMAMTPDYTFNFSDKVTSLFDSPDGEALLGIYLAALAKAALENKTPCEKEGLILFANYLADAKNQVSLTGGLKKLVDDVRAGNTEPYILVVKTME